jgi:hypothetical protein
MAVVVVCAGLLGLGLKGCLGFLKWLASSVLTCVVACVAEAGSGAQASGRKWFRGVRLGLASSILP